jgi:hypothetical protein
MLLNALAPGDQAAAVFAEFAAEFREVATRLGFNPKEISLQWATAAKLATVAGVAPGMLDRPRFDRARAAMRDELLTIQMDTYPYPSRRRCTGCKRP